MNVDTIMYIIFGVIFLIAVISGMIWLLSKNERVAKFFKNITDWIFDNLKLPW